MDEMAIVVEDLHYSYGKNVALSGASFDVRKGEVFGLLGPNGAGKTTLISLLTGMRQIVRGKVSIHGMDMNEKAAAIKPLIGVVPQSIALYPTITVRDNLRFFAGIYGIKGKVREQRIEEVLQVAGLGDRADDVVDTFSGGMKRRLNIAIGILHKPQVLLMDEPTVGVDPQSRNRIIESIEAMAREGMTVVYSTHYMEEAARLCQRVVIMDNGRVLAMDSPAALCNTVREGYFCVDTGEKNGPELLQALQSETSIPGLSLQGNLLQAETPHVSQAVAQVIEVSSRLGIELNSLRVLGPSLETVFLKLTGKQLRDA
jgi:ABC-2 type transport system ATP-binding protein